MRLYNQRMALFRWIFGKSKWLHKYIGLVIILFQIWSAVSGIILNHPDLVSGISVPGWMVPSQYRTENWNRSSLIKMVFLQSDPDTGFVGGKKGVWKTVDGGKTFTKMAAGFTPSLYYGKVNDIHLVEAEGREPLLYAAAFGGLWECDPAIGKWTKAFPAGGNTDIKRIIRIDSRLIIFTPSEAWSTDLGGDRTVFSRIALKREGETKAGKVSLVRLFFDLHGGHAWGTAGRLLFDLVGLLIIFLSISSFYIWYFPKNRNRKKGARRPAFNFFYKYHLKLGIWVSAVLLLIGVTAFFMRPPFLAVIARGNIDSSFYPGPFPDNPWDKKIHNAVHLKEKKKVVIESADGIWEGDDSMTGGFRKIRLPVPVFVMGATVLEEYPEGGIIVGSFNGLFHIHGKGPAIDLLSGNPVRFVSPVRPADRMIAGYFRTPDGGSFISAFEQGLIPLGGSDLNGRFEMPEELKNDRRLPLWNYMFELHNGRIFKDLTGNWYILIIPLGSFLFVLIIITGIYDWLFTRFRK